MDRTQTVDECLWVIDEDDLRKRTVDAVWPVSPWKFRVNSFFGQEPLVILFDDNLKWIYQKFDFAHSLLCV